MYYEFTKIEGKKYSFDLLVDVLFPLWQGNITKIIKIFPSFFYFLLIFFSLLPSDLIERRFFYFETFLSRVLKVVVIVNCNFINRSSHLGAFLIQTILRILTGKKHLTIKLQCLRKIRIWIFVSLVHEITQIKSIFQKNKVVTGKTPLFMIGQFCSRHSICLNRKWLNGF